MIASEGLDISLVRLHEDDAHALALIAEIAGWAGGPVLALLDAEDPEFVSGAAGEGAFAVVQPVTSSSLQSAIECALLRHAEAERLGEKVDQLETALERRTVIERAKGILHGAARDRRGGSLRAAALARAQPQPSGGRRGPYGERRPGPPTEAVVLSSTLCVKAS